MEKENKDIAYIKQNLYAVKPERFGCGEIRDIIKRIKYYTGMSQQRIIATMCREGFENGPSFAAIRSQVEEDVRSQREGR